MLLKMAQTSCAIYRLLNPILKVQVILTFFYKLQLQQALFVKVFNVKTLMFIDLLAEIGWLMQWSAYLMRLIFF